MEPSYEDKEDEAVMRRLKAESVAIDSNYFSPVQAARGAVSIYAIVM